MQDFRKIITARMGKLKMTTDRLGDLLKKRGICGKQTLRDFLGTKSNEPREIGCDKLAGIFDTLGLVVKPKGATIGTRKR